ncbi:MAG TPA: tetratricopeptide repeat protein [Methylibium sp.]|uniref:tetratricopeptide repeat protein n=1 Tax=Methylibium sp. TaxID=2067992 RepID=UPI002DB9EA1C|nr:tetratricopeptide repeat protein [Methylibium sp.]HEU4460187.1 tetratricopeptide repeat protein [Methylibium sp.]
MPTPPNDADFEAAKACFFEGLELLQRGDAAGAERAFVASLVRVPGRPSTLVNLAATRLQLRDHEGALEAADAALGAEPKSADAWCHRATALASLGRFDDAHAAFERSLAIEPGVAEVWLRHARALHAAQHFDRALVAYARGLALDASQHDAWTRRGDLLRLAGRYDDAAECYRRAIEHGGDTGLNGWYLAAVTGAAAPPDAPADYVRALFDAYADDFDEHLVGTLGYRGHEQLWREGEAHRAARAEIGLAIDLGCGTGLCGPLMRGAARKLVGVDLSAPMLAKARERGVYDALVQADVVEHLRTMEHEADLVVAADVLIYLGDLEPLFGAVQRAVRSGALFGFTVEPGDPAGAPVQLLPSLRHAHTEAGLDALARRHGFELLSRTRKPLRDDQREPVDGLYVWLRRA